MNSDRNNILSIGKNTGRITPVSLVNRALDELTIRATAGAQKQRKSKVQKLCKSVLNSEGHYTSTVHQMLEAGTSIKEIFEVYIPETARLLGDYWVRNELNFFEVTLATSRLQKIAREFERLYIGRINSGAYGPEVLIISPKGEQHTFGAQMISRTFRRLGVSPYLSINDTKSEIKKIISKQRFKLVGISLSDNKLVNRKSELMSTITMIKKLKIPIVAGGSLVSSSTSILENLNVDMITDDALQALSYFNIKLSNNNRSSKSLTI